MRNKISFRLVGIDPIAALRKLAPVRYTFNKSAAAKLEAWDLLLVFDRFSPQAQLVRKYTESEWVMEMSFFMFITTIR